MLLKLLVLPTVLGFVTSPVQTHRQQRASTQVYLVDNPELLHRIQVDAVAAFVGGALGVVGTLVVYETRRYHARTRVACPYCEGTGSLVCGVCVGHDPNCPHCDAGRIKCVNCEATGLAIPPQLERKGIKSVDDELETRLDQIGIAAIADDLLRHEAQPGDQERLNQLLARRAETIAARAKKRSKANRMAK